MNLWSLPCLALLSMLACCVPAHAVLINEVAPGEQGGADWVELYNPGDVAEDLQGATMACGSAVHRIDGRLLLAPKGFAVLWFGSDSSGVHHVPFRLSRKGDALVLVAPDRMRILDVFSWPELPQGLSIGRWPDGAAHWGYAAEPTPGCPASRGRYAQRLLAAPRPLRSAGRVDWLADTAAELRYTLDGSIPDQRSPLWTGALPVPPSAVVTVRAFARDAVPSPAASYPPPEPGTPRSMSLRVAPADLADSARGILVEGLSANFAQRGRTWERPAELALHLADTFLIMPVDLWVAGSGSRGLPKKSFKVRLHGRPDTTLLPPALRGVKEWMLRADASPGAFLNDHFMERLSAAHASVEVQASIPMPLLINGEYQGLYRLMPAKNSDLVLRNTDAGAVDMVEGPAGVVLRGDRRAYERWMDALLGDAPLSTLEEQADLGSLLDLACLDLWTGRVDPEMNTRSWRPKVAGGRWRWLVYDMDLWAPPTENSVQRLLEEPAPAAPYLGALLATRERTDALLARITAWNAAGLWDAEARRVLADIRSQHMEAMLRDHAHWCNAMPMEHPDSAFARLHRHFTVRAERLFGHLAAATGRRLEQVMLRVEPPHAGAIHVEGRTVTDHRKVMASFRDAPVRILARPHEGYRFVGWRNGHGSGPGMLLVPGRTGDAVAVFRRVDGSGGDALEQ